MSIRRVMPLALILLAACETYTPTSSMYYRRSTAPVRVSTDGVETPDWMRQRDYRDGGPVPPMEAGRQVNEQPCTEGVPPGSGNLKCK